MLYPDFNDLVALKGRKLGALQTAYQPVKSNLSGNHTSSFKGRGLEFDSVREYVPGDDIRNIDWRVTARTGLPHLKLFKEDRQRHVMIAVDMNVTMRFGTKNTFKSVQAARIAALLGWQGIDAQDCVSACFFGDVPSGIHFTEPKNTKKAFCRVLKTLANPHDEQHQIPLRNVLKALSQNVLSGSLVYFISDFMGVNREVLEDPSISRLRKKCELVFISVNDQADKALYPLGMVGFLGRGKEKTHVNTNNPLGREAYADQWRENRRCLYEIISKMKISLIEMTTESNIERELFLELKKISKRKSRCIL